MRILKSRRIMLLLVMLLLVALLGAAGKRRPHRHQCDSSVEPRL